jgi:hypothetical protein
MAGWSNLTQIQLRTLLELHGQPTDGSKAALVQRLTAFLSEACAAGGDSVVEGDGPSTSEATKVEAAALQVARIEAAAATARATLHAHRVQHNEQSCPLLQLVGQDDLRPTFMRAEVWGVVGLWRLRGMCRAFRRWARAELSSLPRVVAVGGAVEKEIVDVPCAQADARGSFKSIATSSVESLDLSTMRWSAAGCMPSLPDPRAYHSVSCGADGRVVVCGGFNDGGADRMNHLRSTALQWLPGTGAWSTLPDLPARRVGAASVGLPDGRTMLIGGLSDEAQATASVLVLAADGSGWSDLPPLMGARFGAAAALLPDGKVLVAGGKSGEGDDTVREADDTVLNTAELWDPVTQVWTTLPPMAHERSFLPACVLPSGRVAVLGGVGTDDDMRKDGEVYDPVKREWEPLGAEMASKLGKSLTYPAAEFGQISSNVMVVVGGLVAVGVGGDGNPNELYDEGSGRWFKLPHAMVKPRHSAGLVSVPAAALT